MKTPISYYGGKQNMLIHILPLIPAHSIYVEPFFGGGAVFFAKEPAPLSVINDTNKWAITFYRQLKCNFEALHSMVVGTLHSEADYYHTKKILKEGGPDLETAWAFWVQTNMSFTNKIFGGFAFGKDSRCLLASKNKRQYFRHYENCLESAEIFCRDAIEVIRLKDTKATFFYVDPPYFNSDCGHYKGYSKADFEELLSALSSIKGKFLLSSYPSEILAGARNRYGWQSIDIEQRLSVDGVKTKGKSKIESLTFNYNINETRQLTMAL